MPFGDGFFLFDFKGLYLALRYLDHVSRTPTPNAIMLHSNKAFWRRAFKCQQHQPMYSLQLPTSTEPDVWIPLRIYLWYYGAAELSDISLIRDFPVLNSYVTFEAFNFGPLFHLLLSSQIFIVFGTYETLLSRFKSATMAPFSIENNS